MKLRFLFLLPLISCLSVFSQVKQESGKNKQLPGMGNTYAVIIGIANYENENINLNYSNRDAQVFAEYLHSKGGGSVPAENIRLLIDTTATTAAIYNALNWLRDRCETDKMENGDKTDIVYFYFSGHGDVEINTKANLGFLLSFNTPPFNYINNAVRIEDLNDYAHTLSVDFKANVIIITDACHSGKLAGSDNRGSYLVGKELSAAKEKEIRIASCAPEQLSNEDQRWGGGRGVFSYYLINGLKGLADKNRDSIITLDEIKSFVDSSISNDPILNSNKLTQTPVLEGNEDFKLATINKEELLSVQKALASLIPVQSDQDYFFGLLKKGDKLELIDYEKLNLLPKEDIPVAFIKQAVAVLDSSSRFDKITQLENIIRQNKAELQLFTQNLVIVLHTYGQKIINLYLEGDAAELERRRYYNAQSNGYDLYPAMYALALKLAGTGTPMSHILKINQYYFTGVAARLKIPATEEMKQQDSLADRAIDAQKKALELEQNAAYIHNELGILYETKKEYPAAEKYFINATRLAPEWAIPWANLCGLYAETKDFEKGNAAGQVADSLQPDLQITSTNLGVVNEISGNWLFAEEFYRKAIDINSRHYFPFERLGYVYMNTTQYAKADSFFYEADLRKKGYHFKGNQFTFLPYVEGLNSTVLPHCDIDTLILKKDDIMAFFTWGVQNYNDKDYKNAERVLKKVIALDIKNPLVFHYMGKIFYDQQMWEEAEIMFKFAVEYYLDDGHFKNYCDSVIKSKKYSYAHDCFEDFFRGYYYQRIEDYYFLATLYESWAHYEEAETYYRKIINLDKDDLGGYIKLWRMLEKLGRYTEAEKVIKSYAFVDKERSDRELNEFYRRTIKLFPDKGDWPYRLGLMLYDRAPLKSRALYFDTIIWFPKLNKEVFMDFEPFSKLGGELSWDKTISGSPQTVAIGSIHEKVPGIFIPGTGEYITLADAIYSPRKDAITYLSKANELLTETEAQADINFKIGNVFVWSGSKKQAYPYYAKSVQLAPDNAGARLNLIDVCKALYKNRAGLEQLTYLYEHQQINFSKRLLLAEFLIHTSQFEKAKKITEEAQAIHPYTVPETFDLLGRLNLLSHQPARAILFYKDYLVNRSNDPSTLYTIAKLYAQTGNKTEAWKWLESAMNKGFRYSWILKLDPAWNEFRTTANWNNLIKRFTMKAYSNPALANK